MTCKPTGIGTWRVDIVGPVASYPTGHRNAGFGRMWLYLDNRGNAYNFRGGPDVYTPP